MATEGSVLAALAILTTAPFSFVTSAATLVPFRAPATPLWVHSPYINWVMPADNSTGDWVWHVRNDKVRCSGKKEMQRNELGRTGPPMPRSNCAQYTLEHVMQN